MSELWMLVLAFFSFISFLFFSILFYFNFWFLFILFISDLVNGMWCDITCDIVVTYHIMATVMITWCGESWRRF